MNEGPGVGQLETPKLPPGVFIFSTQTYFREGSSGTQRSAAICSAKTEQAKRRSLPGYRFFGNFWFL
jgi:hypothetical protein